MKGVDTCTTFVAAVVTAVTTTLKTTLKGHQSHVIIRFLIILKSFWVAKTFIIHEG